jgi:glutamate/tyrosine decarboxylase-like PLP-dependent enzyme
MTYTSIQKEMFKEINQKNIFEKAVNYAYNYMDNIPNRNVYPTEKAINELSIFDEPLPEHPSSADEVLLLLNEYGSPATVAQTGGKYFGFVCGGAVPVSLAAKWLADVWDQNAAVYVMSPIASKLEKICEEWLKDFFNLPKETVAGYVGGSSIATFCGLAAARYHILQKHGWDVNQKGLFDAPKIRVVLSNQAHGTVFKALSLVGVGREQMEIVPSDSQGRIDIKQLPELDSSTILILQAGNVNSGAFDDFSALCETANRVGAWVHIDGAFGLWAAASKKRAYLTKDIEKADSWSVDGHKTLNTPYDSGVIMCRHRDALVSAMHQSGSYLEPSGQRDGMVFTPDMSRRARSVELWATLKYLGRSGVEALVDGMCERASFFASELSKSGFRVLNDVVFNQVLVACDTPEETLSTLRNIQSSGITWCNGSSWMGEPVIRVSVSSWGTTFEDIKVSVNAFIDARESKI